jgi:hypothetical protein
MLGFFSEGKLRKASLENGAPVTLLDGALNPRRCVVEPQRHHPVHAVAQQRPVFRFGERRNAGPGDLSRHDATGHFAPLAVVSPDDEHFVFLVWTNNGVVRDSIGGCISDPWARGREADRSGRVERGFVDGQLVFARDGVLVRAPFDPVRGTLGDAVSTDQHVDWDPSTGLALFGLSPRRHAAVPRDRALVQTRLVWFDRVGAAGDTISAPANFRQISIARGASARPSRSGIQWATATSG